VNISEFPSFFALNNAKKGGFFTIGERHFTTKGTNNMKLCKKEKLFCIHYHNLRNGADAAKRAGYEKPFEASVRLLQREDIQKEIARISSADTVTAGEIISGYRRLAFGSSCDALKLFLDGTLPEDGSLDSVDLFNVAEIKKPKDGALEIKFFDRLKALEHLEALSGALSGNDSALPLYEALLKSAGSLDKTKGESDA